MLALRKPSRCRICYYLPTKMCLECLMASSETIPVTTAQEGRNSEFLLGQYPIQPFVTRESPRKSLNRSYEPINTFSSVHPMPNAPAFLACRCVMAELQVCASPHLSYLMGHSRPSSQQSLPGLLMCRSVTEIREVPRVSHRRNVTNTLQACVHFHSTLAS